MSSRPLATRLRCWCFLVVLAAAFAYPVSRIVKYEFPATPAKEYRFLLEGYDPYCLFRGRYLQLRVETLHTDESRTYTSWDEFMGRGDSAAEKPRKAFKYAKLSTDPETGLAKCELVTEKPEAGDFLPISVTPDWNLYRELKERETAAGTGSTPYHEQTKPFHPRYRVILPFKRFYVNEKLAKPAEQAMMDLQNEGRQVILVAKLYGNGSFTLEDLIFDGVPFRQYLKERR